MVPSPKVTWEGNTISPKVIWGGLYQSGGSKPTASFQGGSYQSGGSKPTASFQGGSYQSGGSRPTASFYRGLYQSHSKQSQVMHQEHSYVTDHSQPTFYLQNVPHQTAGSQPKISTQGASLQSEQGQSTTHYPTSVHTDTHTNDSQQLLCPVFKQIISVLKLMVGEIVIEVMPEVIIVIDRYLCTLHLSVLLRLVSGSSLNTVSKGTCYSLTISSLNDILNRSNFVNKCILFYTL